MNAIEERIANVLSTQLRLDRSVLGSDVTFESVDLDSLVLVEFALLLGDEFGIEIDDGDLTKEMTLRDTAELVTAKGAVL
ncbi:acyl carrier protein [Micromonospora sp. NBC_01699]|uniref:acyl carrier protein n=1 Tax=Micromonospora sp. NBC_01699 TaxID=2975984 RepID=UPI002E34553F|nr:acyl carrier protein [Micromonospora sp. NBC_01699]